MLDLSAIHMFLMDAGTPTAPPPPVFSNTYVGDVINNVAGYVKTIGSYVVLIIGIVIVCFAILQVVQGLTSRRGGNWLITIGCLLFGGFLVFGGWTKIAGGFIGSVGKDTVDNVLPPTNATLAVDSATVTAGSFSGVAEAQDGVNTLLDMFFSPFATSLSMSVGVALIIMCVWQFAKFFFGKGGGRISWPKLAAMCIIGSILFAASPTNDNGWNWVRDVFTGFSRNTIVNIAEGNSGSESSGLESNSKFNKTDGSDSSDETDTESGSDDS